MTREPTHQPDPDPVTPDELVLHVDLPVRAALPPGARVRVLSCRVVEEELAGERHRLRARLAYAPPPPPPTGGQLVRWPDLARLPLGTVVEGTWDDPPRCPLLARAVNPLFGYRSTRELGTLNLRTGSFYRDRDVDRWPPDGTFRVLFVPSAGGD